MKPHSNLPLLIIDRVLIAAAILYILLLSACQEPLKTNTATLSFAMEGYGNDTIQFYQIEPLTFRRFNTQELVLDASGSGAIELAYPDRSFVSIQMGDSYHSFLHTHGARLLIKGESEDLVNRLTISGKGSAPNQYLLAKNQIIQKYDRLNGKNFFQLDGTEFWNRIEALNAAIDTLNNWLSTQGIDPEIESLLVMESKQQSNAYILNYALSKRLKEAKYWIDIPYDEKLYSSFSIAYGMVLYFSYDLYVSEPTWRASGASYHDSMANVFPEILSKAIDSMEIPEFAKDYYLSRMLLSYFGENLTSPAIEETYAKWQNKYPKSDFRNSVNEAFNNMSSLAPGEPAPVITGMDPYGQGFSTEQWRGQVIYIDVWATWCSPCIKKIPKMHALQEEFKDQSLVKFLYVSIDDDLEQWKKYLSEHPTEGMHIHTESSELRKNYMMGGIPHYILIDAAGNIYQSNAPGPDTHEIKGILNELIKDAS